MTPRQAFLAEWCGEPTADDLDSQLAAMCRDARAAWPDVTLADERFCRHLGTRAAGDVAPEVALARLHAADLYLACACAAGDPVALGRFDQQFLARVDRHLNRLQADPQLVEETRQLLRVRLFMSDGGAAPRIAQYNGTGSLDSWVRVAAVRQALNVIEARRRDGKNDALDDDAIAAEGDLELDYLRERYRGSFAVALRLAISELPALERALLRFHFVDGLTPGHIGDIYGVHRTTTMRRISAAKDELLARTRAHVMNELGMTPSECDSLVELVASRLSLTLSSLFRSRAR